ncbi:MAG: 30S ribosomal protein S20 [Victivallales bacterium]|nr:30S ribosomal protein S20 [Victivallales bacterium]
MPNIQSAFKRLRQNVKRQLRNRMRKSRVKTSEVNLNYILDKKDDAQEVNAFVEKFFPVEAKQAKEAGKAIDGKAAVDIALSKCFSELDKAAKVGVIHINKADRKKSRLALLVAKKG